MKSRWAHQGQQSRLIFITSCQNSDTLFLKSPEELNDWKLTDKEFPFETDHFMINHNIDKCKYMTLLLYAKNVLV